jgi:membrane protease YdiL (CAAX protease family)
VWYFVIQMSMSILIQYALVWIIGLDDYDRFLAIANPLVRLIPQALSMLGVLFLFNFLYRRPLSEMGLVRGKWLQELLLGCLFGIISIALAFGILMVSGQAEVVEINFANMADSTFLISLFSFILVGFNEEILTRGFMMTAFKTTRNRVVIFTGSALIFSLLHLTNSNVTPLSLINIFLVGILFAYMFLKTGKLWAPIGYHITWNFFQGNVFGINVSGGSYGASVITTKLTGVEWITGGAFGAEGGIAVTAVILFGIIFVHFAVKKPDAEGEQLWTFDSGLPLVRGEEKRA